MAYQVFPTTAEDQAMQLNAGGRIIISVGPSPKDSTITLVLFTARGNICITSPYFIWDKIF